MENLKWERRWWITLQNSFQSYLGIATNYYEWFGLDYKSDKNQFSIIILVDSNFHDDITYLNYKGRFCNTTSNTEMAIFIDTNKVQKVQVMVTSLRQFFNDWKTNLQSVSKAFIKEGRSLRKLIKKVLQQEIPHCQKENQLVNFVLYSIISWVMHNGLHAFLIWILKEIGEQPLKNDYYSISIEFKIMGWGESWKESFCIFFCEKN